MTITDYIFTTLWISGILFFIWFIYTRYISKQIDSILNTKKKQVQVNEYNTFMTFDITAAQKEINQLVDDMIGNYVLYHFTINDKEYIGQEDAETMIKEITKTIVLNLSDLYLFYFKMLRSINNDEDLVLAVRDVVKDRSLTYITEANKPT